MIAEFLLYVAVGSLLGLLPLPGRGLPPGLGERTRALVPGGSGLPVFQIADFDVPTIQELDAAVVAPRMPYEAPEL